MRLIEIIGFIVMQKKQFTTWCLVLLSMLLLGAYGVYISQVIRYARASSNYSDFLKRHLHLRNRLLDQGYKKIRRIYQWKKFCKSRIIDR
jgi:hypothetical protein